ncbi:MAG: cyclic nucleotide-binding domain-containing protein [Desulfobacula sp.]|uniref:Crp/Fnr family transcriptional regulator n=1 Tax=Desulfobacula sp. TaxID=2593537 RepID=UPI0025BD9CCE|nr:cyclic nucleotide-binding domain-containing protein [Desulfobacula sp.]MCD4719167.1 cyclic nucleotide-binding domain-containing protein [Desulfobacula sp.]
MEGNIGYIRNVSLFKALQENELKLLSSHLSTHEFNEGETVIHEFEKSNALYILVEGRVKVVLKEADGKEIVMEELGPDQFFGEMGLLDGKPRSADVVCIPRCRMLRLDREDFYEVVKRNPSILHSLVIELCDRLRRANDMIKGVNISQMYIY